MPVVKVSAEAYERIVQASRQTGKSLSEVASELILNGQVGRNRGDQGNLGGFLEVAMGVMGVCGALCVLREVTKR